MIVLIWNDTIIISNQVDILFQMDQVENSHDFSIKLITY